MHATYSLVNICVASVAILPGENEANDDASQTGDR
jgi:hypothetical protein